MPINNEKTEIMIKEILWLVSLPAVIYICWLLVRYAVKKIKPGE